MPVFTNIELKCILVAAESHSPITLRANWEIIFKIVISFWSPSNLLWLLLLTWISNTKTSQFYRYWTERWCGSSWASSAWYPDTFCNISKMFNEILHNVLYKTDQNSFTSVPSQLQIGPVQSVNKGNRHSFKEARTLKINVFFFQQRMMQMKINILQRLWRETAVESVNAKYNTIKHD